MTGRSSNALSTFAFQAKGRRDMLASNKTCKGSRPRKWYCALYDHSVYRLSFEPKALQPAGRKKQKKHRSAVVLGFLLPCRALFLPLAYDPPAAVEEGGQRFSPVRALSKALAASPSQPTPLLYLLRTHRRSGDHAACADDFWKHWAKMRGYRPAPGTRTRAAVGSVSEREGRGKPPRGLEGASPPEGFGDGWAWDAWRGRDATAAAKVAHVAAECFGQLGRSVDLFCSVTCCLLGASKAVRYRGVSRKG